MAPIQTLAHVSEDLIPRDVDRLFPAEFERNRESEKEGKMMLKYNLPSEKFGQKFLEKEDVDYIYEKGKEQEMFTFDAWYASLFDHSDPAQLELSRRINPGWFDRRMRAIDKSLDMQRRIAKIKLFGVQDKEDVMTTYAISTGRINPALYMTNFINPQAPDAAAVQDQYQRGTFAPREFSDYIMPAAQPVGPAMPLDYTGAFAHTGLFTTQATLLGYMQGDIPAMAPGNPAMMRTDQATAFRGLGTANRALGRSPATGSAAIDQVVPSFYGAGVGGLPDYATGNIPRYYRKPATKKESGSQSAATE